MKRLIYTVMVLCAALLCGCTDDEDMLTKQKDSIVRYLTSSRRLIDEQEVSSIAARVKTTSIKPIILFILLLLSKAVCGCRPAVLPSPHKRISGI